LRRLTASDHSREHLAYAVAEVVGFGLCDGLHTIPASDPLRALSLVGANQKDGNAAIADGDLPPASLTLSPQKPSSEMCGARRPDDWFQK
jgi:hypothetical protein